MRVVMLGVNHRTADVAAREKLVLGPGEDGGEAVCRVKLREAFPWAELVVVNTCNRTELYVARPADRGPSADALRGLLAEVTGVDTSTVSAVTLWREQEPAVHHLMRVCCGLDSMLLGETQVLGQVKRAYATADAAGTVGPVLHRVFQRAIGAGKRVRAEAGLEKGRRSVASAAMDLTRGVFTGLRGKTVVGLGAGELTKGMLRAAVREGAGRQGGAVWVMNRSAERGLATADELGLFGRGLPTDPIRDLLRQKHKGKEVTGGARSWDDLEGLLVEADVLACGTSAGEPVVTKRLMRRLMGKRRGRPLVVLDVAMPRDVEPAVGGLANVYLYDLDDLQELVEAGHEGRSSAAELAERRVGELAASCVAELQHRDLGRLIKQLRVKLSEMGEAETERTLRKLRAAWPEKASDGELTRLAESVDGGGVAVDERVVGLDGVMEALLAEHTHRLINKMLHLPVTQMKRPGHTVADAFLPDSDAPREEGQVPNEPSPPLGFYAAALRRLFELEDEPGGVGGVGDAS
ncbi:MAG: glutamyl-tRNA reductase [Planctomycetota bacterium]